MRKVFLVLLFFLIFVEDGYCAERCKKLLLKVKSASEFILGIDFPWWYNLGQIEAESNCMWRTSLDGWGSVGYAQITPRFWDRVLKKYFPNWQVNVSEYFYAHAWVVKYYISQSKCKKLWEVYQCYNRNCQKVNREAVMGNCEWSRARSVCFDRYDMMVCVWRRGSECVQYRSSCDINYSYGYKVWRNGRKYAGGVFEKVWRYW
ncbi:MAG: hypothetical protein QXR17_06915 [Candidatus Bathyarchaeia archaeon]